jgi:TolB-like protein
LVSADVRRTIRGPLAERLVSRGELQLDKMTEKIEAFALGIAGAAVVTAPSKSREPLLAVLPFDNLSEDREMQFFSDGVSEEVIQRLSRGAGMKVIGRTSSFQFRGADKTPRKVVSELGCTHILDGSVRRAGGRVRIAAHLVEAASQTTLWSDRYDRSLEDMFAVQDEIAEHIAFTLDQTFTSFSTKAIDPSVYDLYLRASPRRTHRTSFEPTSACWKSRRNAPRTSRRRGVGWPSRGHGCASISPSPSAPRAPASQCARRSGRWHSIRRTATPGGAASSDLAVRTVRR